MIYKSIYVLLYLLAVTIIMFIEKIRVGLFTVGDTFKTIFKKQTSL